MDTCELCGCHGQHADTTAGEIVVMGHVVDEVPDGVTVLLAGREDGSDPDSLYCAECVRCTTPAQQMRRLLRVHRITRQRAAETCGVSLATVHSWLRRDGDPGHREMPERHLWLLRAMLRI